MQGDTASPEASGIIPRALADLFARLRGMSSHEGWAWEVQLSFLEVYNEDIFDLLAAPEPSSKDSRDMAVRDRLAAGSVTRVPLKLTGMGTDSPVIKGLTKVPIAGVDDALAALASGFASRRTAATKMNEHSSRSHAVLTVYVRGHRLEAQENDLGGEGMVRRERLGVMDIVDLAGSERAKATQTEGSALKEAGSINKSLMVLKSVVNALHERQTGAYASTTAASVVPWRESTLTQILRRSLGGNCLTAIIATISPDTAHWGETQSTLGFAAQVRSLKTVYTQNETACAAMGGAAGGATGGGSSSSSSSSTAGPVFVPGRSGAWASSASDQELVELRDTVRYLKGALRLVEEGAAEGEGAGEAAALDAQDPGDDLPDRLEGAAAALASALSQFQAAQPRLSASAASLASAAALPEPSVTLGGNAFGDIESGAVGDGPAVLMARLCADALASRKQAVHAETYRMLYEASEMQLGLLQPAADALGLGGAAKRQRTGEDGAAAATAAGADCGGEALSPDASALGAGKKRSRAVLAATPMYRDAAVSRVASGQLSVSQLSETDLQQSPVAVPAPARGVTAAELHAAVDRMRAELAETVDDAVAAITELSPQVGALQAHARVQAAAVADTRDDLQAADEALTSAVAGITGSAGGEDGDLVTLIRAAAQALSSERAARACIVRELAAHALRSQRREAELAAARDSAAALEAALARAQRELREAQAVGMVAMQEKVKAEAIAAGARETLDALVHRERAGGARRPSGSAAAGAAAGAGAANVSIFVSSLTKAGAAPYDVDTSAISPCDTSSSSSSAAAETGTMLPAAQSLPIVTEDSSRLALEPLFAPAADAEVDGDERLPEDMTNDFPWPVQPANTGGAREQSAAPDLRPAPHSYSDVRRVSTASAISAISAHDSYVVAPTSIAASIAPTSIAASAVAPPVVVEAPAPAPPQAKPRANNKFAMAFLSAPAQPASVASVATSSGAPAYLAAAEAVAAPPYSGPASSVGAAWVPTAQSSATTADAQAALPGLTAVPAAVDFAIASSNRPAAGRKPGRGVFDFLRPG